MLVGNNLNGRQNDMVPCMTLPYYVAIMQHVLTTYTGMHIMYVIYRCIAPLATVLHVSDDNVNITLDIQLYKGSIQDVT